MIKSFRDEETRQLFITSKSKRWRVIERQGARRLQALNLAQRMEDLRTPPSHHLERLKGDREGQYSIRINLQYRVCFRWHEGGAWDVEVVDYHR